MTLKAKMEGIHGIDVSWIHNTHSKGERNSERARGTTVAVRTGERRGQDLLITRLAIDDKFHIIC